MNKSIAKLLLSSALFALTVISFGSKAERVKDVSMVEGVRSNQLVGYGLVVGLPGTGEQIALPSKASRQC